MRISNESLRVAVATAGATGAASLAASVEYVLRLASPSSVPSTPVSILLRSLSLAIVSSVLLALWLLPGCAVGRWVMSLVRGHGVGIGLRTGLIVAALACLALLLPVLFDSRVAEHWPHEVPPILYCTTFLLTWFVTISLLTPREATSEPPTRSLTYRAGRTALATLGIVSALAWTALFGMIGGTFASDKGSHRLLSTSLSPDRGTRAYAVHYLTPGGGLGHVDGEVYLLPASETWSETHRGLLIWWVDGSDDFDVEWESDRILRVRLQPARHPSKEVRAYARDGFTAHTVVAAGPSLSDGVFSLP